MRREIGQETTVGDTGFDVDVDESAAQGVAHRTRQPRQPVARSGTDRYGVGIVIEQSVQRPRRLEPVDLVQDQEGVLLLDYQLFQDPVDGADLVQGNGTGRIGHVEQQIGLPRFFECRLEAGD
jgi:hypothetical protein